MFQWNGNINIRGNQHKLDLLLLCALMKISTVTLLSSGSSVFSPCVSKTQWIDRFRPSLQINVLMLYCLSPLGLLYHDLRHSPNSLVIGPPFMLALHQLEGSPPLEKHDLLVDEHIPTRF